MSSSSSHHPQLRLEKFEPSVALKALVFVLIALGGAGTVASILSDPARGWAGYLIGFFYVSCLGLGGLFWAAVNNLSKAGWSVSIRRIAESMTAFIPVILIGGLFLYFGMKHLYAWTDPEVVATQPLVGPKTPYLNIPFMLLRIAIFGIGMILFAKVIVGNSIQQDHDGDESRTVRNVALSIAFVLFFAITFSLFSVDLLMSLLPTWYSTIFGVYTFAGLFQSSLAFLILLLLYVKRAGYVQGYYSIEHVHDVAKFLKGFTVFWAYIAFSQFMLIWYANIPEETEFFLLRAQNGWTPVSALLVVGKFVIPFLGLLPRGWKRNELHLTLLCTWVLLMQFVDIYWIVGPNFNENHMTFGLAEVAPTLGFLGLFLLCIGIFLKRNNMVALKDPRMSEALSHHVSY